MYKHSLPFSHMRGFCLPRRGRSVSLGNKLLVVQNTMKIFLQTYASSVYWLGFSAILFSNKKYIICNNKNVTQPSFKPRV